MASGDSATGFQNPLPPDPTTPPPPQIDVACPGSAYALIRSAKPTPITFRFLSRGGIYKFWKQNANSCMVSSMTSGVAFAASPCIWKARNPVTLTYHLRGERFVLLSYKSATAEPGKFELTLPTASHIDAGCSSTKLAKELRCHEIG